MTKIIKKNVINLYNMLRGLYWSFVAKIAPGVHGAAEMKRQHQTALIRKVNIKDPIYFNEKMLWLTYYLYNKSPIVAKCYNKYLVREYVESKGLPELLNTLYFKADSIQTIPWNNLPEECVIKLSNGCSGHVFKRKDKPFSVDEAIRTLEDTERRCKNIFNISGSTFAYGTRPVYICEKLIKAEKPGDLPTDYKIYCFHGKPMFLYYIHDRVYDNEQHTSFTCAFIDIINMKDRYDLERGCTPISEIVLPASFNEMLKYATILSEDFPFVRVDFYEENSKPIFGELTFTPSHRQTKTSLEELGSLIDLSKIDKYKEILKVK